MLMSLTFSPNFGATTTAFYAWPIVKCVVDSNELFGGAHVACWPMVKKIALWIVKVADDKENWRRWEGFAWREERDGASDVAHAH